MIRTWIIAVFAGLLLAAAAPAQSPAWHFHWQTGQVLTYRVEHVTSETVVDGDSKPTTKSKLNLTKRWQVVSVDAKGVATLQLSLAALRHETTPSKGDAMVFDSASPDKSNPQLREQLSRFVGTPLAMVRMDGQGQVIEVKESKNGPASRFEAELPFTLVLPNVVPAPGQSWERAYRITLEPPQGTGEKFDATQRYTLKTVTAGTATVVMATTVKTQPEALPDRIPLVQYQPEGEISFDTQSGLVRSVNLRVSKELPNYQGEKTSYQFQSTYKEEYVAGP